MFRLQGTVVRRVGQIAMLKPQWSQSASTSLNYHPPFHTIILSLLSAHFRSSMTILPPVTNVKAIVNSTYTQKSCATTKCASLCDGSAVPSCTSDELNTVWLSFSTTMVIGKTNSQLRRLPVDTWLQQSWALELRSSLLLRNQRSYPCVRPVFSLLPPDCPA